MEQALNQNAGAQDDTGNAGGEAGNGGGNPPQTSWRDGLPDELKSNESLKSFETPEAVAKAYLETMGKVPVTPEKAEAYQINIPEGHQVNEGFVNQFKTWAFDAGLSQDQASKLSSAYVEAERQMIQQVAQNERDAVEGLKREWLARYDENMDLVKRTAVRFGGDDLKALLGKTNLINHPAVARAFFKIGQAISEDKLIEGDGAHVPNLKYTQSGTPMLSDYNDMPRK